MSSNSLARWRAERADALQEIENAHVMVGGADRGRRYATQQINYSYAALLSSHFQGFSRDLHSECVDYIVAAVPPQFRAFLRAEFVWNRSLDRGNPHPGAIGSDYNRLGIAFWPSVTRLHSSNVQRMQRLQELVDWRNAIAHQDFGPVGGEAALHLSRVRAWRRAMGALANDFDRTMQQYLTVLLARAPW